MPKTRNPLRLDPTKTGGIRKLFVAEIQRRLARLAKSIVKLVDKEDAFGLRGNKGRLPVSNRSRYLLAVIGNKRFAFETDSGKLDEFQKWLETEMAKELGTGATPDAWWDKYIEAGFKKGAEASFDNVRSRKDLSGKQKFYQGTKEEFLRSAFNNPADKERVRLLASRVFTSLKGINGEISNKLTQALTDGIVRGLSPRDIARTMSKTIESISKARAATIARTEVVRANAEGSLMALERLDIKSVTVMAEWSTAGDSLVCPLCADLNGIVLTISEAKGAIPRHPNCRCAWIPANVGEKTEGQTRPATAIQKAIADSVQKEFPKLPLKEALEKSNWAGADTKPARGRPKQFVDATPKKKVAKGSTPKAPTATAKGSKKAPKTTAKTPDKAPANVVLPPDHLGYKKAGEKNFRPTEFQQKVWKEIGDGLADEAHASRVGKLVMEEVARRVPPIPDYIQTNINSFLAKSAEHEKAGELSVAKLEQEVAFNLAYKNYPDTLREVLKEIRDFGGAKLSLTGDKDVMEVLERSSKNFPTKWIEQSNKLNGTYTAKEVDRGYYSFTNKELAVSRDALGISAATATHEIAHAMEKTFPSGLLGQKASMRDLQKQFMDRRVDYKKEGVKSELSGLPGEFAWKDEFKEHYIGKNYTDGAYEVLTMGVEGLMHNRYRMYTDSDMTHFIVGVLAGK